MTTEPTPAEHAINGITSLLMAAAGFLDNLAARLEEAHANKSQG